MTEHPPPSGSSRIWHVPCSSFNLVNGCRVRAEALARRLWPLGSPQTATTFTTLNAVKAAASGLNGAVCYDCPGERREEDEDYRGIVKRHSNNPHSCGWENPVAMLGASEEDEYYDPEAGSSPPSPAVDEIVVNPPVPLPILCKRSLQHDEEDGPAGCETTAVNEQPRRQQQQVFRRSDAVDINGLCEKLQRYADSRSFSDPDSDTYYEVESGIGSPDDEEASRCDSVDGGDPRCDHHHQFADKYGAGHVQESAKFDGDLTNGYCDFDDLAYSSQSGEVPAPARVNVTVPNGEINVLADLLYGECQVTSSAEHSPPLASSPQQSLVLPGSDSVHGKDPVPERQLVETTSSSSSSSHYDRDATETRIHKEDGLPPPSPAPDIRHPSVDVNGEVSSRSDSSAIGESGKGCSDVAALSPWREDAENLLSSSPKSGHGFLSADDESDGSRSPVRRTFLRSTSLKTGKTPPGTPHRKKIVRFADALGLDLELVRTIASDDVPTVPASAFTDLKLPEGEKPGEPNALESRRGSGVTTIRPVWQSSLQGLPPYQQHRRTLCPEFGQPVAEYNFLDRVRNQGVCLENVVVTDLTVDGVVRVLNISFEKSVLVRYTVNEWTTSDEVVGRYVHGSCDGFSDKFAFTINVPFLSPGQRLIFAVRFVTNGREYWDNNFGANYVLRCINESPQYLVSPSDGPLWLHHFV